MNLIDRLVEYISPESALRRKAAREILRSYDGGKLDRRTQAWNVQAEPGDTHNYAEVSRLRARSWDLYRNNHHARKLVNTIISQVIGRGITPESQATNPDGTPDEEFRAQANQVWRDWTWYADASGAPGRGGQVFAGLCHTALRETILSGETLVEFVHLTKRAQNRRQSPIPLSLNVIQAERLAETEFGFSTSKATPGNRIFRGIEVNDRDERVAYWLYDEHPNDSKWWTERYSAYPYSADNFIHLYAHDRANQMRGVPWFAPIVMSIRDVGDLQQNELLASALRACIAIAIRRNNPGNNGGLLGPTGSDTTDANGNLLTRLQPGMMAKLGPGEEFVSGNLERPNVNVESFATHMTRGVSTGVPGVKSSTLTADYRNSSFSSERSADNDTWREVEIIQDWFANQFLQPIYDEVIEAAVSRGLIGNAEGYWMSPDNYTAATWQGPVQKSINPVDDATADSLMVKGGLDSLQNRISARGGNWREVLRSMSEVYSFAEQQGIPKDVVDKIYGTVEIKPSPDPNKQQEPAPNG